MRQDTGNAKHNKRTSGLFVRTDSFMLAPSENSSRGHGNRSELMQGALEILKSPVRCIGSVRRAVTSPESTFQLLASPVRYLDSARRALATAPCQDKGHHKIWMRLELRLPMQTLVDNVGNGRLGWFRHAIRMEVARKLDLETLQVEIHNISETCCRLGGCQTAVELIVTRTTDTAKLSTIASELMDQVNHPTDYAFCKALHAHVASCSLLLNA